VVVKMIVTKQSSAISSLPRAGAAAARDSADRVVDSGTVKEVTGTGLLPWFEDGGAWPLATIFRSRVPDSTGPVRAPLARPAVTTEADSFRSTTYEVDDLYEANELYQRNGWTDGLPIVPPTEPLLRAALATAGLAPGDVVGVEPVRQRRITAEKLAVNAIMAGCRPEYLPVVVAVVQAVCEPQFSLHGCTASTGGAAPFLVVNGPIRSQLGMNSTHNALGNASRANATIGRALRLIILNVLGGLPGLLDRSTLGHPGKFTYCVAEDEEDSPWLPLAQERDVPTGASAVTVLGGMAPHQIMNEWTHDPRELLDTFVAAIRANMLTYSIWPGNYVLVVPKQLRDVFGAAGWQKRDLREYLYERCRVARGDWRGVGKAVIAARGDENREYIAFRSPEDILVVAAGGPAGGFGAIVPPWYGPRSLAVTKTVTAPVPTADGS
jgi:hypothetical protein